MYYTILISHIFLSFAVSFVAFFIVVRSFLGVYKKINFSDFYDFFIPKFAVILLYVELILGLLLYALHISKLENFISQSNADAYFSYRFWAIEHTILMLFAIIFGHLGLLYTKNIKSAVERFKKNLTYFGLSFILITVSLLMNMLKNA